MRSHAFAFGMRHPLQATVMYPPARGLFAPHADTLALPAALADGAHLAASDGRFGLYIHVPFCETKCAFCDYATLIGPRWDEGHRGQYVDTLLAELTIWRAALPSNATVSGLDFGGGTPMALTPAQIGRLLGRVRDLFPVAPGFEVSFETTPTLAQARPDDLASLAALGVGRISMGVQSLDSAVLRAGARALHAPDKVHVAMGALRRAGFGVVNLDLMFAQLGQDIDSWDSTVRAAIALAPDVITIYDTVYKRRPIAALGARSGCLPTVATYADAYDLAYDALGQSGYRGAYGTVNFSRVPGRLGTSRYLEGRILELQPYIGCGLYASTLVGDAWAFRPRHLNAWRAEIEAGLLPRESCYGLPRPHVLAKSVLLQLSYGFIDVARLRRRFGGELDPSLLETLDRLVASRLMSRQGDRWTLTAGAFGALPGIRAALMPETARRWIAEHPSLA